jgi:hypothetical protein
MPMRGEMRPVPARSHARTAKLQTVWSAFVAVMSNQDLQCTAIFCAIGLLATINLLLRLPVH